jgi:hypothetical protein
MAKEVERLRNERWSFEGARLQAAPYIVFKEFSARLGSHALSKPERRELFPQALKMS